MWFRATLACQQTAAQCSCRPLAEAMPQPCPDVPLPNLDLPLPSPSVACPDMTRHDRPRLV